MAHPLSGGPLVLLPLLSAVLSDVQADESQSPFTLGLSTGQTVAQAPASRMAGSRAIAGRIANPFAEAIAPQFISQVVPSPNATQTQVVETLTEAGAVEFEIGGGTQAGGNLFHRFDQLDLSAGQIANFLANPTIETIFSQVGGSASSIDGLLKVSGGRADLFLLNPAGIVFGANARLDLSGSFTATTATGLGFGDRWLDLLGDGFDGEVAIAGPLTALEFSGAGEAVVNQGQLAVSSGQALRLMGEAVVNTGDLTAPGGEITVAAAQPGQRLSLGGGLLNLAVAAPQLVALPSAVGEVLSPGFTEAIGLQTHRDGSISLAAGTTAVSGKVATASIDTAGGEVNLLGATVALGSAEIDASGIAGGTVRVGGDFQGQGELLRSRSTQVDGSSVLRANASIEQGGEVIVWSDGSTAFAGRAEAQGGLGDSSGSLRSNRGGLVETSGLEQLAIAPTATVDTTALQGEAGTWLLDPANLTVVAAGGTAGVVGGTNAPAAAPTIDRPTLEAALNGNNVQLQASNSITVNTPIDTTANGASGDLQLDAPTANLNQRIDLRGDLSGTATAVNVGINGSVQNGADVAAVGGTVSLAAATYREGQTIDLARPVTIRGQGAANTTISGDVDGDDVATGDLTDNRRVLINRHAGTILADLTIANGATQIGDTEGGAGVLNLSSGSDLLVENTTFINNQILGLGEDGGAISSSGTLTVNNSTFEQNSTTSDGGAIDINQGTVTITNNSRFIENSAGDHGGAIDFDRGVLTVFDTIFIRNIAVEEAGAIALGSNGRSTQFMGSNLEFRENIAQIEGGAIRIQGDATVELIDSIFADNEAVQFGGAIAYLGNASSSLIIRSTTPGLGLSQFENNRVTSALSNGGRGGAIYIDNAANTTFTGVDFLMNEARNDGGAILARQGGSNLTINNSNFEQNSVLDDDAGAIYLENGARLDMNGGTFDQNTAIDQGGAIAVLRNSQADIRGVTFSNNSVTNDGGALSIDGSSATLTNSEFRSNRTLSGLGGAIAVKGTGSLDSTEVDFVDNTSVLQGGAISTEDSAVATITMNSFVNNRVLINPQGNGGAIFANSNNSNALTVLNGDFTSNSSVDDGGAITVNQGTARFSNVDFLTNDAINGHGGGLDVNSAATVSITGGTFVTNQADAPGGGINTSGTISVDGTTFDDNTTTSFEDGGAIAIDNAVSSTIQNATFVNNQAAGDGGAIDILRSSATFSSSRFENNRADSGGGGAIDIDNNGGAGNYLVEIDNSLFLLNRSETTGGAIDVEGNLQLTDVDFSDNRARVGGGAIIFKGNTSNDGLNITGGDFVRNFNTSTALGEGEGGALFLTSSTAAAPVLIQGARFEENTARSNGGAISIDGNTTLALDDVDLRLNRTSTGAGGAISARNNASLTLLNDTQVQTNTSAAQGGGLSLVDAAQATIRDSSFQMNTAVLDGGAISANSSLNVERSVLEANIARSGGGINLEGSGGAVSMSSTVLDSNIVSLAGGGLNHSGAQSLTIVDSTLSNNRATFNGGALNLDPTPSRPPIQLQNTTVSGNTASGRGGGLSLGSNAQVALNNVTVVNNSVANTGGGLSNEFGGSLALQNTIVAGNTATTGSDIDGLVTSLGNNLVQDRGSSSGYIAADLPDGMNPQLLPLADNGGLTQTHALRGFSPAVNGGNSNATLTGQRGLNAVDVRDIGAYELDNALNVSINGGGQTTTVSQAFTNPIEVSVADSFGSAIAGLDIAITGPLTGATANLGPLRTNDSGVATTTATANTVAGGYSLSLNVGNPFAVFGLFLTNTADVPDQITVLNGNNQSTVVNTAFANPLQVAVADQFGNQIPNQTINLSLLGSGASANAGSLSLMTDSTGSATTSLTANTVTGSYAVGLTSGSLSNSANLTNVPDAPAQLAIDSGNSQSTIVNTAFANPLQLTVTDQFGNAVPGVTVGLSLPGAGASANGGAIALTTNGIGQATTSLSANTVSGSYNLGLSAGALNNSLALTNLPDAPSLLNVINGNNQSAVVNTAFANPLLLSVTDQFGNPISGVTVNLNLPTTDATANAGSVVLTTNADGQASTGLVANTVAGGYSLGLSGGGLASAVPLVNLPDSASQIAVLSGDGQSALVNSAFADPLLLEVTDQFGNAVTGATVNLSLPDSGASLAGGTVALTTDNAGQATTSFVANTVSGSYGIGFSTGSVSNSVSLSNLPDRPAQLALDGDDQRAQINTAFVEALRLQVLDQFGNAVPGATVTFSAPVPGLLPTATAALSSVAVTTDGAGQGQITAIANGEAGAYPVQVQAGAATAAFALENTIEVPLPELPNFNEPPAVPALRQLLATPGSQTIAEAPLSFASETALTAIDSSFSAAYTSHWGSAASEGVTVAETRSVLNDAAEAHGVKSAVVYGLFVPQDSDVDANFGATQAASMALNRRAQNQAPRDDDQLMLVLVPNEGPAVQRLVSVTRAEVLRQARLFRMAVADPEDQWSYRPLARQLYDWLFAPIEPDLARLQLDNVMYALDAGLRTVPLAAMMDGDEFAIERYGISLIPSVDLLETDFGASAPPAQILAGGATEFEQLNDLPAVRLELDAIAARTSTAVTQASSAENILLDEAFTQTNLIASQTRQQAKMMHLATHAEFNAGDIDSSYLQFWDSRLTLDQLSKLGWNDLELLILSACQTALSSPEAELGFAGLAAATGVESTIGSLWSVSDVGTLALMSEFHGQLSQQPLRFEALRQAQLALSRGETRLAQQQLQTGKGDIALPEDWSLPEAADFSHPFYWSGFTLVGNPWW